MKNGMRWGLGVACLMLAWAGPMGMGAEPAKEGAGDIAMKTYHLKSNDVVLFLGDSITQETKYYYKMFFEDIDKKYPDLIEEGGAKPKFDTVAFKGAHLTFVNGGVSGETAAMGLKRLPALLEKWKPTVCVVCFGMNDRYKDRAGYVKNMTDIVEMLKKRDVAVTILTSPNVGSVKHGELKSFVPILGDMAFEMKALAAKEKVGFADCYTPTKAAGDDKGKDVTWGDGIHPNEEGHRIMADVLEAAWGFGKPLAKETDGRALPTPPTAGDAKGVVKPAKTGN